MTCRFATLQDQGDWNNFIFASPHGSFLQSWEWGKSHDLLEHEYWRLIIEEAGNWQAAALVVKRDLPLGRCWLYAPRGPIFTQAPVSRSDVWHTLQEKLTELGIQEKAIFVRVDPAWDQLPQFAQASRDTFAFRKSEREVQPQHTLLLDLAPDEEMLLANMHAKTRYNVRLAQRKGVIVRFSTSLDAIDIFLQLAKQVTDRSGFSYHPDNYYRALLSALAPSGMLEVAIAEYKGQALTAHMIVYAGGTATYAHGASSQSHRNLMAPQLAFWETIRRAKQKNMKTYDFFGVAPAGAGKQHPWAGITRVKEGFGGRRVSYIGAYDLVLDENFYTIVNTIRRVKQLWR